MKTLLFLSFAVLLWLSSVPITAGAAGGNSLPTLPPGCVWKVVPTEIGEPNELIFILVISCPLEKPA